MADFVFHFAYLGIALTLIGRGIGVPIPEDIPLLTAGFLCAREVCELQWMLPLAWASVLLADSLSFLGGRFFRGQLPKIPVIRLVFSPRRMGKAERLYRRHGLKGLLAARFMLGLRTPLYFTAGAAGVSFPKFFFVNVPAVMVSVSVLIFLGWYFPTQLERIRDISEFYKWGGLVVVIVVLAVFLFIKRFQTNR